MGYLTLILILVLPLSVNANGRSASPSEDCVVCTPPLEGTPAAHQRPLLTDVAKVAERIARAPSRQWTPKEMIARIGNSLCRSYLNNNFKTLQAILRKSAQRFLDQEMKLEEAYRYLRCQTFSAVNIDLIRLTAEHPTRSRYAAQSLVYYFVEQVPDSTLLGKIVLCKRDFSYGHLDVFEQIEKNIEESQGDPVRIKNLNDFKKLLRDNLPLDGLKRDPAFCQQFFDDPAD